MGLDNSLVSSKAVENVDGFLIEKASGNTFINNLVARNNRGIILTRDVKNNEIIDNEIVENGIGIELQYSKSKSVGITGNTAYNNLFNNTDNINIIFQHLPLPFNK